MNEVNVDSIVDNIFHVMPLFHRKLLRMDLERAADDLTRLHFAIMRILYEKNVTVSELAKILRTTRPQMTYLIDHLVKLDIVKRQSDVIDRRVINLSLTEKGIVIQEDVEKKVKENVRKNLAGLTPEELSEMELALEKLREIGTKL